jgi:hypothetical protein
LWRAEGRLKKQIAELAGVSRPTVDLWLDRYEAEGLAGLVDWTVPDLVDSRSGAAAESRRRDGLGDTPMLHPGISGASR